MHIDLCNSECKQKQGKYNRRVQYCNKTSKHIKTSVTKLLASYGLIINSSSASTVAGRKDINKECGVLLFSPL